MIERIKYFCISKPSFFIERIQIWNLVENNTIHSSNGNLLNILCYLEKNIKTPFERFNIYSIRATSKKFQFMMLREKSRSLKFNLMVKRESAKIDRHCLKNEKYLNDLCRVINYKHVLNCITKYLTLEKVKLLRPDFTNSQCNYVTQKLYIKTLLKKMPLTLNFFSWITRF